MSTPQRLRKGELFLAVAVAFTAGLAVGWLLQYFPGERPIAQKWLGENSRTASTKIAAVDTQGNGLLCDLRVEVRPGKGDVYPPVQQLVEVDFQYSQWTAVKVAADYSKVALDKKDGIGLEGADVYFSIAPPPGVIERIHIVEGPSAGAAMTILTIAAIENKVIRPDVVITGEILPDGTLGIVGGIFPKAKAAEDDPVIERFLVPEGQPVEVRVGYFWTRYEQISVLIDHAEEEGWGLQIEEIPTIEDAVKVMLS